MGGYSVSEASWGTDSYYREAGVLAASIGERKDQRVSVGKLQEQLVSVGKLEPQRSASLHKGSVRGNVGP